MSPIDAAKSLVKKISLPSGAVSVMVQHDEAAVFMRVMVEPLYLSSVNLPSNFEGYEVRVETRENAFAL